MRKLLLLLFVTANCSSFCQSPYDNDAGLWFILYLEKKITKKIIVHLNQQDRFLNNISQFKMAYADAGITYKFTKHIKVLADYVLARKAKTDGSFSTRHQYYAAIILKQKIGRWAFSYRNLLQREYINPITSSDGFIRYHYDRNKVTVKYEWNKYFELYTAEELFVPLNNPTVRGIDRTRAFIGLFYNITRRQQLELYYMFQAQLQKSNWFDQDQSYSAIRMNHDYVIGIGYSIEL